MSHTEKMLLLAVGVLYFIYHHQVTNGTVAGFVAAGGNPNWTVTVNPFPTQGGVSA